jgi:PAT family beta-lactamase induction signal transducer AmpG
LPSPTPIRRSKLFWVGLLSFASGFPLGVFYEIFPVFFRQQGVDLKSIGFLSLLQLPWSLKFLWAPAVDHYRHHRLWMAATELAMGAVMLAFAYALGVDAWVWFAIFAFTLLSATNDIAVDGYTIEYLEKHEYGLANGVRIGLARVGMLTSGVILMLSDFVGWRGAYGAAAGILVVTAIGCLAAPRERAVERKIGVSLAVELAAIARQPRVAAAVAAIALATLWLVNNAARWSVRWPPFWPVAWSIALAVVALVWWHGRGTPRDAKAERGPMFGALLELLERPKILPVLAFVLLFKLGDASMGFMVKPFWVDSGFTATDIGLVSVNIGLALSIAGGLVGGWYADRAGIFKALWVLGLWQAASNLGYVFAASMIAPASAGLGPPMMTDRLIIYAASATESFTGGLGTAAFVAFLMAIVDKRRSATEYALLSSLFAASRAFAGWASGFGAEAMGYAPYFLLTFFLSFPAYLLLPWARRMLDYSATLPVRPEDEPVDAAKSATAS